MALPRACRRWAVAWLSALLLAGAAHAGADDGQSGSQPMDIEVDAPDAVRTLLRQHLDAPHWDLAEALTDDARRAFVQARIERQARELLETEGYYTPHIDIALHALPPRLVLAVTPGARVRVAAVELKVSGAVNDAHPERVATLHATWALPVGAPFRHADWEAAKRAALLPLLTGAHPVADIRLQAQRLRVLSRPDRQLEVSGSGHVDGADGALRVRGELRAERARMLLARADTPTRSDDVVVLGRVAPERGALPRVEVDVKLDLGDDFLLQGRGLDLRLGGSLRARAPPGVPPRLTGSVAVVRGSYAAYGQRLDIERGILTFQGPVDNPGLDILALRRNQPVEAGVAITGTAQAPRARLVSRPEVPDGDKLSWLVLGRGGDDLARGDIDVLSAAAGALLAAGESVALQARLAQATGLDEIGLRGGGALEQTVVTLGKRLSTRAYLGYEQGVTGLGGLVKLDYRLTRRWSLQARSGRENSVDLFYTFRFD